MDYLVAARNQVVHHVDETYGAQLSAGAYQEVFDALETLLANLGILRSAVEHMALLVLEGLRDVTFRDTPEYEQMAALCATFQSRIGN